MIDLSGESSGKVRELLWARWLAGGSVDDQIAGLAALLLARLLAPRLASRRNSSPARCSGVDHLMGEMGGNAVRARGESRYSCAVRGETFAYLVKVCQASVLQNGANILVH